MTFNEFVVNGLVKNGMFPDQAIAALHLVKNSPEQESMLGRWGDSTEGYPAEIKMSVWYSAKRYALQWIDTNKPKAWFRSQFE